MPQLHSLVSESDRVRFASQRLHWTTVLVVKLRSGKWLVKIETQNVCTCTAIIVRLTCTEISSSNLVPHASHLKAVTISTIRKHPYLDGDPSANIQPAVKHIACGVPLARC